MAMTAEQTRAFYPAWAERFAAEREALIALDGKVGDSDLGITMSKGFAAARDAVRRYIHLDVGIGEQFARLFRVGPLHFGDYGGLFLKVLWALLDIFTIIVLGSGVYLWLAKKRVGEKRFFSEAVAPAE